MEFIPPPRAHCHRYHSVLAPNSKLRKHITAHAGKRLSHHITIFTELEKNLDTESPLKISPNYLWTDLLARIYEVDPLKCPSCGTEMRLITFIVNPETVKHILTHLRIPTEAPQVSQENPFEIPILHFF